jgi:hypothetical protein
MGAEPEEADNNSNIDKWEEQNKENEINELETLEFSVKREEFHPINSTSE